MLPQTTTVVKRGTLAGSINRATRSTRGGASPDRGATGTHPRRQPVHHTTQQGRLVPSKRSESQVSRGPAHPNHLARDAHRVGHHVHHVQGRRLHQRRCLETPVERRPCGRARHAVRSGVVADEPAPARSSRSIRRWQWHGTRPGNHGAQTRPDKFENRLPGVRRQPRHRQPPPVSSVTP